MSRRSFGHRDFYRYEPTRPRDVEGGLKARSKRGAFASSWWAGRWIESLERLVDTNRLGRGKRYARRGQVMAIAEYGGGVEARVMGSRMPPYEVSIEVAALDDATWDRVLDRLAERALFVAALLAGELPQEIEEVFAAAGASLFPDAPDDLFTSCSCPDWANPCKHVAAVHYILAERFDDDPFLLLRLRGRDHEALLEALRARGAGGGVAGEDEDPWENDDPGDADDADEAPALEDAIDRFWEPVEPLDAFPISIAKAQIEQPVLRRLGEPAFVTGTPLGEALGPALAEIAARAIEAAEEETQAEPDAPAA